MEGQSESETLMLTDAQLTALNLGQWPVETPMPLMWGLPPISPERETEILASEAHHRALAKAQHMLDRCLRDAVAAATEKWADHSRYDIAESVGASIARMMTLMAVPVVNAYLDEVRKESARVDHPEK